MSTQVRGVKWIDEGKKSRQIEQIEIKGSHAVLWRDKGSKESKEEKVLLKTIKDIKSGVKRNKGRNRFNGIQVWNPLGQWNIEELIKQSRPLVHNHVPALTCNGMIVPVLV